MSLCVGILQVDDLGECFDDLVGQFLVPFLPFDQVVHLVGTAHANENAHSQQAAADQKDEGDHGDANNIAGHIIPHALHRKVGADIADAFARGVEDGLIAGQQPAVGIHGLPCFDRAAGQQRGNKIPPALIEIDELSESAGLHDFARFLIYGVEIEDDVAAVLFDLVDVEILKERGVVQYTFQYFGGGFIVFVLAVGHPAFHLVAIDAGGSEFGGVLYDLRTMLPCGVVEDIHAGHHDSDDCQQHQKYQQDHQFQMAVFRRSSHF